MVRKFVAGIPVDICTNEQVMGQIARAIQNRRPLRVHTLNVDHVVLAHRDAEFVTAICSASMVVPDGMPIVWVLRLRGYPAVRVTGTDLMSDMLRTLPIRAAIVGGGPGVADTAARAIAGKGWPGQIVFTVAPTRSQLTSRLYSVHLIETLNRLNLDTLFVALGAPTQEIWLRRYDGAITVPVRVGVGAGVDFLAGRVQRAPEFVRNLGFEWLYRMVKDPVRLGTRYIGRDWKFFPLVLRYKSSPAFSRLPGQVLEDPTRLPSAENEF